MSINERVGSQIKNVRQNKLKITQEMAANKLYISLEAYQRWESGKTNITVTRLWDFHEKFGIPFCELLPEDLLGEINSTINDQDPIKLLEAALYHLKLKN